MTRSTKAARITRLVLPLSLLTVSGCCGQKLPIYPPSADLAAVTEAKPVPTIDILTSEQASEHYNANVESWGDRISAAGGRLCRYFKRQGMTMECPPARMEGDK